MPSDGEEGKRDDGGEEANDNNENDGITEQPITRSEVDAATVVLAQCTKEKNMVKCSPAMLLLYLGWIEKKNGQLQLCMPQCNHNTPNPKTAIEITNNMYDNFLELDNLHQRVWSNDGEVVFLMAEVNMLINNDISFFCVTQKTEKVS